MTMFKTDIWEDYKPKERVGKLCYYLCSKQSILPIRDILDDHGKGNKRSLISKQALITGVVPVTRHQCGEQ